MKSEGKAETGGEKELKEKYELLKNKYKVSLNIIESSRSSFLATIMP